VLLLLVLKQAPESVSSHGEGISLCLPTISDLPAFRDTEISFLWNIHISDMDWKKETSWYLHCV